MWHNANLSLNVAFFRNDPHATSTAGWRLITFPCGMPACVTPRETSHPLPEGESCTINVCFWPFGIFFSSDRGSFLVLSAPWHAGSSAGPRTQVLALVEVRGTCSGGSKWQLRSGRDSEHVELSRPKKTHVQEECPTAHIQVKGMSDDSHVKVASPLGEGFRARRAIQAHANPRTG